MQQRYGNFYKYIIMLSVFGLASCAYAVDTSNQDITFVTPGAEHAECVIVIDKLKYQARPPQTLNLIKSSKDMEVMCKAPGNRAKAITVPSAFAKKALWGGPAGVAWDYASQTLYYYPSVIVIDFSQEKTKPNPYPQYNSPDVDQPETHNLEEFSPAVPALNSDKNKAPVVLMRKDDLEEEAEQIGDTPIDEPKPVPLDKGDLSKVIERVTAEPQPKAAASQTSVSPAMIPMPGEEPALEDIAPQAGPAAAGPVKLFPGQ